MLEIAAHERPHAGIVDDLVVGSQEAVHGNGLERSHTRRDLGAQRVGC